MITTSGLSLDEIMMSNAIDITSGKDLSCSDKESVYDVAARLSKELVNNQPLFTSPQMGVRFLRKKYADHHDYARGILLLDAQHKLKAIVETPFMIAKEMLSLAIKHKASAIVSFDIRHENKANIEREFSKYTNKIMASIDIRHLDHLEIDFCNDDFLSHAEKGWL